MGDDNGHRIESETLPEDQLLVIDEMGFSGLTGFDNDGALRVLVMIVKGRRNHTTERFTHTYLIPPHQALQMLSGGSMFSGVLWGDEFLDALSDQVEQAVDSGAMTSMAAALVENATGVGHVVSVDGDENI